MCTWYNKHFIVYNDMQEVCGSSGLVTALVLRFAGDQRGLIAVWTFYLMLNT